MGDIWMILVHSTSISLPEQGNPILIPVGCEKVLLYFEI